MRVGVDIQPIAEVRDSLERHGDRYRDRVFTDREITDCGGRGSTTAATAQSLAARFAAKEATLKVLRIHERVPPLREIEVVRADGGRPVLQLHGLAAQLAQEAGLSGFDVSLSHTDDAAIAVVIAAE